MKGKMLKYKSLLSWLMAFLVLIILIIANKEVTPLSPMAEWIYAQRSDQLTLIMKAIGLLGSKALVTLAVFGMSAFYYIKERSWRIPLTLISTYILSLMIALIMKLLFAHPRPDAELWLTHASSYSFPSGHATRASFFLLTLASINKERFYLFLPLAILAIGGVALSRVYLGVHYPQDVWLGFLIGAFCSQIFSYSQSFFYSQRPPIE